MSLVSPSALQVDSLLLNRARIVTSFHQQGTRQPKKLTDQDKALSWGLAGLGLKAFEFNSSDLSPCPCSPCEDPFKKAGQGQRWIGGPCDMLGDSCASGL